MIDGVEDRPSGAGPRGVDRRGQCLDLLLDEESSCLRLCVSVQKSLQTRIIEETYGIDAESPMGMPCSVYRASRRA